jgi:hypothetical protein
LRYSMEDLIRVAKDAGYSPTPRMVQDWVELGLLDRPERRGRGRGKGVSATWPEEQRGLLLSLLEHRRSVSRIGVLCNIPVWTWLYFGDSYVPLRQVRRALGTWGGYTTKVSWSTAKRAARQLLDDASHPQAHREDKRALLDAAAPMILHLPQKFDEETLLPLLERIVDPNGTGLSWTMGGMEVTPGAMTGIVRARLRGLAALAANEIDDSLFHWARYAEIVSRAQYATQLARMTKAGSATGSATVPTARETVLRACSDLCTLLGLGIDNPGEAGSTSLDHPAVWNAGNLRSVVRGAVVGSEVRVTVEVREEDAPEPGTAEQ